MRLTHHDLRDAIDRACASDPAPPLVQNGPRGDMVNIDGDLDLALMALELNRILAAFITGRPTRQHYAQPCNQHEYIEAACSRCGKLEFAR